MKYISIDIETTGLDPEKHQILEFAAVYDDLEQSKLLKFHRLIYWEDYVINRDCLKLHEELLKEIRDKAAHFETIIIEQLASHFGSWLARIGSGDGYNVAGKNFAGFDGLFLKKIPSFPKWHHRVIDVGSMYLEADIQRLPGLGEITGAAGHRALPDALAVVTAIRNRVLVAQTCPLSINQDTLSVITHENA